MLPISTCKILECFFYNCLVIIVWPVCCAKRHRNGWDTLVSDIMGPDFQLTDFREKRATIRDVLSHRMGLVSYKLPLMLGLNDNYSNREYCRYIMALPLASVYRLFVDQWCSGAGTRGNAVPALFQGGNAIHHYFAAFVAFFLQDTVSTAYLLNYLLTGAFRSFADIRYYLYVCWLYTLALY